MAKSGVSFRVYQNNKVKHKVRFFDKEVYPLYIIITLGSKSLNFKSKIFENLLKEKYQTSFGLDLSSPGMEEVILYDLSLISFIIQKLGNNFSLELLKKEYQYYSTDVSGILENHCKQFLVRLLSQKRFHFLKTFIMQTFDILTPEIILKDMHTALRPAAKEYLFSNLPPYTRLFEFCRQQKTGLPILTYFEFSARTFHHDLTLFLNNEYEALRCIGYARVIIESASFDRQLN